MGRPSKLAGAAVFAVLLLGCSGVPQARRGADQEAPDGVDYIRAVQCGGLLWALPYPTDAWMGTSATWQFPVAVSLCGHAMLENKRR